MTLFPRPWLPWLPESIDNLTLQNLIKVGIGIDRTKIPDYRLKQVIESYLRNSAALTNEHDWKKLLLPYTLKIEEIGSNNGRILAEKQSGKTQLIWKE